MSTCVSATDATPQAGGSTDKIVSVELAESLYHLTQYKGFYTRLDSCFPELQSLDSYNQVIDNPVIREIVESISWMQARSHDFNETQHVNLQELGEMGLEVKGMVETNLCAERQSNFADSMVGIDVSA